MADRKTNPIARAMRLGMLSAHLEDAKDAADLADNLRDLLTPDEQLALKDAGDALAGLGQRVAERMDKERRRG